MMDYAEAVKAAKLFIEVFRTEDGFDVFDKDQIDHAEAKQMAQKYSSPLAEITMNGLHVSWTDLFTNAIKEAETDRFAFLFLRHTSALYVEGGSAPPPPIQFWLRDFLTGKIAEPKKRKGRPAGDEHHFLVRQAVKMLVDAEMKPTRKGLSNSEESACDAVAMALRSLKLLPNSYSKVKRIWTQKHPEIAVH